VIVQGDYNVKNHDDLEAGTRSWLQLLRRKQMDRTFRRRTLKGLDEEIKNLEAFDGDGEEYYVEDILESILLSLTPLKKTYATIDFIERHFSRFCTLMDTQWWKNVKLMENPWWVESIEVEADIRSRPPGCRCHTHMIYECDYCMGYASEPT
jgi:hypothetical protein